MFTIDKNKCVVKVSWYCKPLTFYFEVYHGLASCVSQASCSHGAISLTGKKQVGVFGFWSWFNFARVRIRGKMNASSNNKKTNNWKRDRSPTTDEK